MKHEGEHYYIITIQYLGFRFHGWQKQPKAKTIQEIIEKTLRFIFKHNHFKTLANSRTDTMVSALENHIHLTTKEFYNCNELLISLNKNLPPDINAIQVQEVPRHFNIINQSISKTYHYLFSYGERNHPFCAPLMSFTSKNLNIKSMQKGAKLFEGTHQFTNFTPKTGKKSNYERTIFTSEISENTSYQANFFPKISYLYTVKGNGFMHYQIRMMMGQLFRLGKGEITLIDLKNYLLNYQIDYQLKEIAPASGLTLVKNEIEI